MWNDWDDDDEGWIDQDDYSEDYAYSNYWDEVY